MRFFYVGRKPCGCVMAVVVDDPNFPGDVADSVSEIIRSGLPVQREAAESFTIPQLCADCSAALSNLSTPTGSSEQTKENNNKSASSESGKSGAGESAGGGE